MSADDTVRFTVDDAVGRVVLNRPARRNAINLRMLDELAEVQAAAAQARLRALVLVGAGGTFCSGLDLAESGALIGRLATTPDGGDDPVAAGIMQLQRIIRWFDEVPFPTIAAVSGVAVGGGFELATSCDLRIVATDARLGLPEIRMGLVTDFGGSQRLPRLVGLGRAKQLLFTGEPIDGVEAHRIGWANTVVAADEVEGTAMSLAGRLADQPAAAMAELKVLVGAALDTPLPLGLELEAHAMSRCVRSTGFGM